MNQKIKDEAREKIADYLAKYFDAGREWGKNPAKKPLVEQLESDALKILSLSGEIDEVCDVCLGGKRIAPYYSAPLVECPKCKGAGTIKESWYLDAIKGKRPSGI